MVTLERGFEGGVEAARAAAVHVLMNRHKIGLGIEPFARAIGADVVDDDDLVGRAVLRPDGGDTALERFEPVIGGDDGGDGHCRL